ncbi:hypothetical protein MHZ92_13880 [Sporosarcina sp. ACRSL]|uniref:hypothetical protein n=1 Tax=Sporosarcina sp. ACRSL TaxID=2918215 RepID=UPI001EF6F3B6|nr:hypothetical protein [Sporosarcina sp. ACRSL]MCG7345229.1 hypothetical protein [Sporosarcina sp. ACRSL]
MRGKIIFIQVLFIALIASGCTNKTTSLNNSGNSGETTNPKGQTENNEVQTEKANPNDRTLVDFFLPAGSTARFRGEGNEFAKLDIDFAHPYENYVILHENNGGTVIRKIYKIEPNQITTLEQRPVDLHEDFPSLEEIEKMEPIGIYLKKPFEVGTTFDDWEIIETDVKVDTPFQKFDHALIIEQKGEGFVNRTYLVEGFGEVKRESIMDTVDPDEKYIVTSTLESVTKPE